MMLFCFLLFGFFAAALGGPGDSGRGRHLPTLMSPLQHMGGRVFCFLLSRFFAAALGGPGHSGRGRHLPILMFPLQHMGTEDRVKLARVKLGFAPKLGCSSVGEFVPSRCLPATFEGGDLCSVSVLETLPM